MDSEICELDTFLNIIDVKIKSTKAIPITDFIEMLNMLSKDIMKKCYLNEELTHVGFFNGGI